jgi:hypothetical protein
VTPCAVQRPTRQSGAGRKSEPEENVLDKALGGSLGDDQTARLTLRAPASGFDSSTGDAPQSSSPVARFVSAPLPS